MNVLLLPYFDDNSYQALLRNALEDAGATVRETGPALPFVPFVHQSIGTDVVHLHWTHPYFLLGSDDRYYRLPGARVFCFVAALWFLLQLVVAKRLTSRFVWTVHNLTNHERHYPGLDRWVNRRVAASADVLHVWDENTRAAVVDAYDVPIQRTTVIPHGNYEPTYGDYEFPEKADARGRLGVEEWDRVYLFFGLLRRYKGVTDLLERFPAVREPGSCLLVAGNPKDETLRREVEDLAVGEDAVHLDLRYIPEAEVPVYFAACDAAIFPYRHVFNSGSILLSMSLSRPFVAPRLGSVSSIAPDGNVLYDDLDSGLREVEAMSDRELAVVGDRNRSVAMAEHDWEFVATETIAMFCGDAQG